MWVTYSIFLAPIRPVASLVQREVRSRLEACHEEAVQQPRKCVKCGKIILSIAFSHWYELSLQIHALNCIGTAFCFCTQYNTGIPSDPCPDLQLPALHL